MAKTKATECGESKRKSSRALEPKPKAKRKAHTPTPEASARKQKAPRNQKKEEGNPYETVPDSNQANLGRFWQSARRVTNPPSKTTPSTCEADSHPRGTPGLEAPSSLTGEAGVEASTSAKSGSIKVDTPAEADEHVESLAPLQSNDENDVVSVHSDRQSAVEAQVINEPNETTSAPTPCGPLCSDKMKSDEVTSFLSKFSSSVIVKRGATNIKLTDVVDFFKGYKCEDTDSLEEALNFYAESILDAGEVESLLEQCKQHPRYQEHCHEMSIALACDNFQLGSLPENFCSDLASFIAWLMQFLFMPQLTGDGVDNSGSVANDSCLLPSRW